MLKKLFIFLCLSITGTYVIADQTLNTPSTTPVPTQQIKPAKQLNNPAVGSRQAGSEQIFGDPKMTQSNRPPPPQKNGFEPNNPTVGGRQSGSEQIFGQSATPSATTQTYTKPNINRGDSNSPTVGGRQAGSEQLFGQSAAPTTSTSPTK
jgi:hypothetical protein